MNVNLIVRHGTTTAKRHKKKDIFHRFLYSKVSHYVGISKHLVNNIREIFPLRKKAEINLIYSSLKFSDVSKRTRKEKNGVVNIVHVGRLTKGKGQDVAIRACSVLYDNGVPFRLVLVGSGDVKYKEMLEKMLPSLPYKESVVFHGHTDDVFSVLGASEVFLFPSAGEGLPNALIEALSCGLVCLVYSNTVFPEIFNLGFYGHVIENGNEDMLGKTLLSVCQNIDKEMDRSKNNMDLARQVFSEEREIAEYDKIMV
jgi:glycosyltransferase involved in cell wall biosynthesis